MSHGVVIGILMMLLASTARLVSYDQMTRQTDVAVHSLLLQDRTDLNVRSCIHIAAALAAEYPNGWSFDEISRAMSINGRDVVLRCRVLDSNEPSPTSIVFESVVSESGTVTATFTFERTEQGCTIVDFDQYHSAAWQEPRGGKH